MSEISEKKTESKYIDKDPPMDSEPTLGKKIVDYLAFLKEKLNFIFATYGRRLTDADGHINELTRTADVFEVKLSHKVDDDEIISRINQSAETISIEASKINLNGAVTANNNVTIDVNGVISAVGASLTNVDINGGSISIQSGTLSNNAIVLKDSTATYQGAFRPSGFETKYNNLVTATMESYGGINVFYREIPGVVDSGVMQFGCWGGTKYKGVSWLRFDGLGIEGGPNGPTNFDTNGSRGYFVIDVGTGQGSSYVPSYSTNLVIEKWGNGAISKEVTLDVNGLKFSDSNGNITAEYPSDGDCVIAKGTFGDWTYRKWASKTYECWARIEHTNIAINNQWQNVWYHSIPTVAYPVNFVSSPFEQVSVVGGDGAAWISGAAQRPSTSQSGKYYLFRPETTAAAKYVVDYYVRGTVSS